MNLNSRQRTGAWIAGAVGYGLWGIGALLTFGILVILLATLIFGAFFGGISFLFGGEDGLADFSDDVPGELGTLALLALGVAVLGITALVGGVLASRRILREHDHDRPTAVTWAGIGVASLPSLLFFWIITFPAVTSFDLSTTASIALVLAITTGASTVIGALTWRWMAHTFAQPVRQ